MTLWPDQLFGKGTLLSFTAVVCSLAAPAAWSSAKRVMLPYCAARNEDAGSAISSTMRAADGSVVRANGSVVCANGSACASSGDSVRSRGGGARGVTPRMRNLGAREGLGTIVEAIAVEASASQKAAVLARRGIAPCTLCSCCTCR